MILTLRRTLRAKHISQQWLITLAILTLGLGAVLLAVWSLRAYGPGVSTDSVDYMFTARNLAQGRGFLSYNEKPYTLWPPLYPLLLACFHRVFQLDLLKTAWLLNILAGIGIAVLLTLVLVELFPQRRDLAFAGGLAFFFSPAVFGLAQSVNSDYLLVFLVLGFLYTAGRYLSRRDGASFSVLLLWGMLAALQRYLGLAAILSAATIGFLYPPQQCKQRLWPALYQLLAAAPLLGWIIRNYLVEGRFFGIRGIETIAFDEAFSKILQLTIRGFFPSSWAENAASLGAGLVAGLIGGMIASLVYRSRRKKFEIPIQAQPMFIFAVIYLALLILSLRSVNVTAIQLRFVTPLILPITILILFTLQELYTLIRRQSRTRQLWTFLMGGVIVAPFILGGINLVNSFQMACAYPDQGVESGNMYNNRNWHEMPLVQFLRTARFDENTVLFSNIAAGAAFHSWHPVLLSPRAAEAIDPRQKYSLEQYRPLFDHPMQAMFLIWIEPNYYEHVFPPASLRSIVDLKKLHQFKDGSAIYQILPASSN